MCLVNLTAIFIHIVVPLVAVLIFHWPSRYLSRTLTSHGFEILGGNRVYLPTYVQRWESWVLSRGTEKDKRERAGEHVHICMCSETVSSLRNARGRELRGKVVKGEFYSRWGSELLPSVSRFSLSFYFSFSLSLFLRFDHSTVCELCFAAFAERIPTA